MYHIRGRRNLKLISKNITLSRVFVNFDKSTIGFCFGKCHPLNPEERGMPHPRRRYDLKRGIES